jgi:hypothetical protein
LVTKQNGQPKARVMRLSNVKNEASWAKFMTRFFSAYSSRMSWMRSVIQASMSDSMVGNSLAAYYNKLVNQAWREDFEFD